MKKIIFGIFAHPDDEAFGPSGTLLKLASEGYDIHLILLTDGDAGINIDTVSDLAATRLSEWQTSAKLIGASSTHPLHYPDGELEKIDSDDLDNAVSKIIAKTIEGYPESPDVSFMTFEPNGLTGHRDHIAASRLTTRISRTLAAHEVWYFCLDSNQAPLKDTAYYEPRAREDSYITARVEVSAFLADKYCVMDAHVSQRSDAASMKKLDLTTECFHIDKV